MLRRSPLLRSTTVTHRYFDLSCSSALSSRAIYSCSPARISEGRQYCRIGASRSQSRTYDRTAAGAGSHPETSLRFPQAWQSLRGSIVLFLHYQAQLHCRACARGKHAQRRSGSDAPSCAYREALQVGPTAPLLFLSSSVELLPLACYSFHHLTLQSAVACGSILPQQAGSQLSVMASGS